MRVLHERKSRKLKHLDEKGAEHQKVDATRALVRSLSTKIKIAIQVVDKISVKINNLRDEELWPQLNEFIQGYVAYNAFFLQNIHPGSSCSEIILNICCVYLLSFFPTQTCNMLSYFVIYNFG